jgi:hypothetical protein
LQAVEERSALDIPDDGRVIARSTSSNQLFAVGRERQGVDDIGVPFEQSD